MKKGRPAHTLHARWSPPTARRRRARRDLPADLHDRAPREPSASRAGPRDARRSRSTATRSSEACPARRRASSTCSRSTTTSPRRGGAGPPGQGGARRRGRREPPPGHPQPPEPREDCHGPRDLRPDVRRDLPGRAAGQDLHRRAGALHPLPAARGLDRRGPGVPRADPWSRSRPAPVATLLPDALVEAVALADLPGRRDRCCSARRPAPTPPRRSRRRSSPPRRPSRSPVVKAAVASFLVLFAAEWGDLSQLLTISFVGEVPRPPSASSSAPGPRCWPSRASPCSPAGCCCATCGSR